MKLEDLTQQMRSHADRHTPGHKCHCWDEYKAEVFKLLGCEPDDQFNAQTQLLESFAAFWVGVADNV